MAQFKEQVMAVSTSGEDQFELSGVGAKAVGELTEKGFLVRAGSIARKEIVPSGIDSVSPIRKKLLSEGVLVEDGEGLRFTKDYLFDSPSGAAAAVLGRIANGWTAWKQNNETLATIKRVVRTNPTENVLSEDQRHRIIKRHEELLTQGKVPSKQRLDQVYALFRSRFGPSVLAGLDGEQLLTLMHDHSNRDSLVYWLEFKTDEEFETRFFGSIAGGSALKFRIFRRKETGTWQAGTEKGNQPQDITNDEAVGIARSHRDQLLRGVELLEALPAQASDEEYAQLQDQMDELAPDVSRLAWGHKYFSMLFPDKLDDYHSPEWQRFILLKLLQLPPEGDGRYICAGRFVAASREVGLPTTSLDAVLNTIYGSRHWYWKVDSTLSGAANIQLMQERNCVAVGWPKLGDIAWADTKSREKLRALFEAKYPEQSAATSNAWTQLTQFVAGISEGDIVLAAAGETIHGVGRVVGEYAYDAKSELPHQRPVEWLNFDEWQLPEPKEGLKAFVRQLRKHSSNVLAIEQRIQNGPAISGGKTNPPGQSPKGPTRLSGLSGHIQSILERKGQVILYGPPGTGKTYWAERTANELAAMASFQKSFDSLDQHDRQVITGSRDNPGLVRFCCFHPAYGYEDFLEGYRPHTVDGHVEFRLQNGVFKKLCRDAEDLSFQNFYLIVDEINRGDIPRIFGELLTALEKDKRQKGIVLPLSQERFTVPPNIYLIGTMNTADRSISLLDAALRRRFGFVELMPDGTVLKDAAVSGIPLQAWFDALNRRIREHVGRDARNLQIGHSYLMHMGSPLKDLASLKRAIHDDIIPLLEEYCYEDYGTLENILGGQIVDVVAQRIRHELFDDGQDDALVQALLTPFADISTSTEAIASEEVQSQLDDDDEAIDS